MFLGDDSNCVDHAIIPGALSCFDYLTKYGFEQCSTDYVKRNCCAAHKYICSGRRWNQNGNHSSFKFNLMWIKKLSIKNYTRDVNLESKNRQSNVKMQNRISVLSFNLVWEKSNVYPQIWFNLDSTALSNSSEGIG